MLFVMLRDSVKHPIRAIDTLADAVFQPGETVAKVVVSPGHDFAYLVGMPLLAVFVSIIFYGALIWIVLSLPTWWRNRS